MDLRPATVADVPAIASRRDAVAAIARVHVASWRAAYRGLVSESFLQAFTYERREERWREFLATSVGETYMVQSGSETVGILTLGGTRDADVDTRRTGEIWGLYISPGHWRKGIGSQVVAEAERMLKSGGYEIVVLWVVEANERARQFYEAMGFALDGAAQDIDWGMPVKAVRYRKEL